MRLFFLFFGGKGPSYLEYAIRRSVSIFEMTKKAVQACLRGDFLEKPILPWLT
jgi:hypothetical protein